MDNNDNQIAANNDDYFTLRRVGDTLDQPVNVSLHVCMSFFWIQLVNQTSKILLLLYCSV